MEAIIKYCKHGGDKPEIVRAIMLSIYSGRPANLSEIQCLPSDIRLELASMLMNIGVTIYDYQIREAFARAGRDQIEWFLAPLNVQPRDIDYYLRAVSSEPEENTTLK